MKKLILHSRVQWNLHFIEMFYLKSETAKWLVKKVFKPFPVEPSTEYIDTIIKGYHEGDFSRVDVMIEITNIHFELDRLRKNHEISYFLSEKIYDYSKEKCSEINIIL